MQVLVALTQSNGCSRQGRIKSRLEGRLSVSALHGYLCYDQSFRPPLQRPYIANSPQVCTRNGDLPGPAATSFFNDTSTNMAPKIWTILHRLSEEHWRHFTKVSHRRSRADQCWARILAVQTALSKSCRAHRRDGNGQYGSPSLMVLCSREHSCLYPFALDHVVKPVRIRGLPYRCLSFEDRSSSDKTLPR